MSDVLEKFVKLLLVSVEFYDGDGLFELTVWIIRVEVVVDVAFDETVTYAQEKGGVDVSCLFVED